METKKINLSGLEKVLSPKEMKNVTGGSEPVNDCGGSYCFKYQCSGQSGEIKCDCTYDCYDEFADKCPAGGGLERGC